MVCLFCRLMSTIYLFTFENELITYEDQTCKTYQNTHAYIYPYINLYLNKSSQGLTFHFSLYSLQYFKTKHRLCVHCFVFKFGMTSLLFTFAIRIYVFFVFYSITKINITIKINTNYLLILIRVCIFTND